MKWERPSYITINMNAEIGGYQEDDFEDRAPIPSDRSRATYVAIQNDSD
jgi:hypothetical protein